MLRAFRSKQFILFVVTGGIAALVNFGSRFVFSVFTSFGIAVILSYLLGMVTAFALVKLFVFKETVHSAQRAFFFVYDSEFVGGSANLFYKHRLILLLFSLDRLWLPSCGNRSRCRSIISGFY